MAESSQQNARKKPRNEQRKNAIEWDDYFMAMAFLARHRSKDPNYQVGACIVNGPRQGSVNKKIMGVGYNGLPTGCKDEEFPWLKSADPLNDKHAYVCHAEANAILYRNTPDVTGCTLYVTLFPCNECAKLIIQSGIKEVVYFSDEISDEKKDGPKFMTSMPMFDAAGVKYEPYIPKHPKIEITFSTENLAKKQLELL